MIAKMNKRCWRYIYPSKEIPANIIKTLYIVEQIAILFGIQTLLKNANLFMLDSFTKISNIVHIFLPIICGSMLEICYLFSVYIHWIVDYEYSKNDRAINNTLYLSVNHNWHRSSKINVSYEYLQRFPWSNSPIAPINMHLTSIIYELCVCHLITFHPAPLIY